MSLVDIFVVAVLVVIFGAGPTLAVFFILERRRLTAEKALFARLDDVNDRLSALDSAVIRSSISLEGTFTETIKKVQAEIKSLEIVFRGAGQTTRENPESVDAAIRLAREGVSSDLIVAKTGLPLHAVESIISLHGRR
jgi:uncharacterized protein